MDVKYGKLFRQRQKTQHFFTGKDSGYLNKFFDEHKDDSFKATAARQKQQSMPLTIGGRKRKHSWQEIPRKPYASEYRRQTTRSGTKRGDRVEAKRNGTLKRGDQERAHVTLVALDSLITPVKQSLSTRLRNWLKILRGQNNQSSTKT